VDIREFGQDIEQERERRPISPGDSVSAIPIFLSKHQGMWRTSACSWAARSGQAFCRKAPAAARSSANRCATSSRSSCLICKSAEGYTVFRSEVLAAPVCRFPTAMLRHIPRCWRFTRVVNAVEIHTLENSGSFTAPGRWPPRPDRRRTPAGRTFRPLPPLPPAWRPLQPPAAGRTPAQQT